MWIVIQAFSAYQFDNKYLVPSRYKLLTNRNIIHKIIVEIINKKLNKT